MDFQSKPKSWNNKSARSFFLQSGWFYLFIFTSILSFIFFNKHLDAKQIEIDHGLKKLQGQLFMKMKQKERLLFNVDSLKDSQSVELILKQELGLVSEGQTKVHFAQIE